MSKLDAEAVVPTSAERDAMHALYRQGGRERQMPPHLVDAGALCPHEDCDRPMQAIDFRLEDHGRAVHDSLVRAWWDDTGIVRRCPRCGGWIHFTIRGKRAITPDESTGYPQLPADWFDRATIL